MAAFKIFSVVGMLCMLVSAVVIVVSLATNYWVITTLKIPFSPIIDAMSKMLDTDKGNGDFSFNHMRTIRDLTSQDEQSMFGMPNPNEVLKTLQTYKDHLGDISMKLTLITGLKKFCISPSVHSDGSMGTILILQINKKMKTICQNIDDIQGYENNVKIKFANNPRMMKLIDSEESLTKALSNVQICEILGLVLALIALILSMIKLPCVRINKKSLALYGVIIFAVLAVVTCVAGIALLHVKFSLKKYFDDFIRELPTLMADIGSTDSTTWKMAEQMLAYIKISEHYGYSYYMIWVGVGSLVLGIVMNVCEGLSARTERDDGYEISLLPKDDYQSASLA